MKIWSDKKKLRFVKKSGGNIPIDIRIKRRAQGDEDNFDG
jgi:hypothetical protein